jgi:hypothetical protein
MFTSGKSLAAVSASSRRSGAVWSSSDFTANRQRSTFSVLRR